MFTEKADHVDGDAPKCDHADCMDCHGQKSRRKTRPIRFGIFGTGWMADTFAQELEAFNRSELVAVASSTPTRAEAFSQKHPTAAAFADFDALAACEDVDVVYIATTTDRHFRDAMVCIEHGKPVLVEKPMVTTVEQMRTLISRAEAAGVFFMEAMWMRCFPVIRDIEAVLSDIAPLRTLEAAFCIDVPYNPRHRIYNPALGGGALWDVGIYPLHLLHRLWGFDNADMRARLQFAPTGTDQAGVMDVDYSDGRRARLTYGVTGQSPHRAVFKGENGTAVLDDFFHPSALTVHRDGCPSAVQHFTYPVMGYDYEIEVVVDALAAGETESRIVPHAATLEVVAMMAGILESARS